MRRYNAFMTLKHINCYYCDNPVRDQRILHGIIPETQDTCPECGRKMHISSNSQRFDYRYSCTSCGYYGPMLSCIQIYEII